MTGEPKKRSEHEREHEPDEYEPGSVNNSRMPLHCWCSGRMEQRDYVQAEQDDTDDADRD
jgi:hypothetical protein